jgi:hypothetical protein
MDQFSKRVEEQTLAATEEIYYHEIAKNLEQIEELERSETAWGPSAPNRKLNIDDLLQRNKILEQKLIEITDEHRSLRDDEDDPDEPIFD